jgi:capsid assembly protease
MHALPRIASRIYGTPLLVARPKLDIILRAIGPRLVGLEDALAPSRPAAQIDPGYAIADGIAVVPIVGTMVGRSNWLQASSGLVAYADIGDRIEAAAADPAARALLLELDSPGGEVGGLFDLVDRIHAIRAASGKPVWAIAAEAALSAAYAIASAADRIYVTQTGEAGSIGVVAVHVDESGADAQDGLAWTFIHAGARKVDGNSHQPLSDHARADLQADVDLMYGRFVAVVARNRRLNAETVQATEAGIYRGQLAVRAGLADQVGTLAQAAADLTASLDRPATRLPQLRSQHMSIDEPAPGPAAPAAEPAPANPNEAADRVRAEYSELVAIAAQAARVGIEIDVADALAKAVKPDALRQTVLDQLAARADAATLIATAPRGSGESPIVRRARERAAQR